MNMSHKHQPACIFAPLTLTLAAADPVGFLGTKPVNAYPSAKPVTEWSESKNIIWKTKLPAESNALPVCSNDKIFVLSEPSTIVALNRTDGRLLWQKTNTIKDAMTAEDVARAKEFAAQREEVQRQFKAAQKEFDEANQALRKDRNNQQLRQKQRELRNKVRDLQQDLEKLMAYEMPKTHRDNGYSSATPVTDGELVCCFFGNGVGAAYNFRGNRLWIQYIERPGHKSWGRSSSPVIVDGKVFIVYKDLHALDLKTGRILFTVETGPFWERRGSKKWAVRQDHRVRAQWYGDRRRRRQSPRSAALQHPLEWPNRRRRRALRGGRSPRSRV